MKENFGITVGNTEINTHSCPDSPLCDHPKKYLFSPKSLATIENDIIGIVMSCGSSFCDCRVAVKAYFNRLKS